MLGRWSIRTWLGSLAAVVALPLLVLLVVLFAAENASERERARDEALRIARFVAGRMEELHTASLALLERMAARPAIRNFDGMHCDPFFAVPDFYPQYANIFFFDAAGRSVCSGTPETADRTVSAAAQEWIGEALRNGTLPPRTPTMRILANRWVSVLTVQVQDDQEKVRGTLALVELPEVFGAEAMLPPNSVATVLDRNGTVVARSSQPHQWSGRSVRDTPLARLALRQPEGRTEAVGVDGVSRQYGFTYVADVGWHIYVGIPTESVLEPVKPFLVRSFVGGVLIIGLVTLAALMLARRIQKPIDALARAAAAATRGTEATVAAEGPREVAVLASAFNDMVVSRARSQVRIAESERNLKALSERLLLVEEDERRRIAREIHDDLGQSLTALKMDVIGLLETNAPTPATRPVRERITRTLDSVVTSVQRIAAELRPTILDDLGLGAAIESEARLFEERTGIECEVSIPSEEELCVDAPCATTMYRIVKEALTNVFRHSGATRVELRVRRRGDELLLEIRDDGRGMTSDEILSPSSLGLIGMRERAAMVGGTVHFEGIAKRGSIVSVRIPSTAPTTAPEATA